MFLPEEEETTPIVWSNGRTRRGIATGIDQAVSSATNFALAVAIARNGTTRDFGAYTLAITGFALCIAFVRALVADPLMVFFSAHRPKEQKTAGTEAVSAGVLISLVFSALTLLVSSLLVAEARTAVGAMGIILAGVLLQDTLRFVWFSAASPTSALVNDGLWMVTSIAAYGALAAAGVATMPNLLLAWGATGTLCFLIGLVLLRIRPRFGEGLKWLKTQRSLGARFAGEVAIDGLLFEFALVLIASIAGLPQLGIVFAGRLLLAPVNVLFMGITAFAIPEAVRLRGESLERMNRLILVCVAGSLLAVMVWSAVCLVIPARLGTAFLGTNWTGARALLLPTAIGVAAFGVAQVARSGLRALADARRSLRARAIGSPGFVIFGSAGAAIGQGRGAAWGLALAFAGLSAVMWLAYRASLADAVSRTGSPGSTPR